MILKQDPEVSKILDDIQKRKEVAIKELNKKFDNLRGRNHCFSGENFRR